MAPHLGCGIVSVQIRAGGPISPIAEAEVCFVTIEACHGASLTICVNNAGGDDIGDGEASEVVSCYFNTVKATVRFGPAPPFLTFGRIPIYKRGISNPLKD